MGTIFDLEHLQQLTYERSKTWATFLEDMAKKENLEELHLSELDNIFGSECDEEDTNDELASMEDTDCNDLNVDPEILVNLTNTTRLSLLLTNTTVALPGTATEEESKIVDLFNQTMPIINEHNRQLKEYGLDKILSTFDKRKIEEKVGSWLNRHNSLYGGDATLLTANGFKEKEFEKDRSSLRKQNRRIKVSRKPSARSDRQSDDSDDSLQSGETARYIRSSKVGAVRNSSSSTTMIKTYRLVKSTRDALREKYACGKDDDDEYHLKTVRHRRRFQNDLEYHHNHYDLLKTSKSHKREMHAIPSSCKKRRKLFRKRPLTCRSTTGDSSDSDLHEECAEHIHHRNVPVCCNQYHCPAVRNGCVTAKIPNSTVKRSQRKIIKMSSAYLNRMYYYSHNFSKSFSTSSSSASFTGTKDRSCLVKTKRKFPTDTRPCKRESECKCRNERKLCKEYKHVADTSTEEWYVENCGTPRKILKMPSSDLKPNIPLIDEADLQLSENENMENISKSKKLNSEISKSCSKVKEVKSKQKTNATKSDEESFNRELQMAIELSKELYEKEQQFKSGNIMNKSKKYEGIPTKPLRKISTNSKEQENNSKKMTVLKKRTNGINNEDEVAKKLSKLVEDKKVYKVNQYHHNDSEDEALISKIESNSSRKVKKCANKETEEKLFDEKKFQVICNSNMSVNSQSHERLISNNIKPEEESRRYSLGKCVEQNINKDTDEEFLKSKAARKPTQGDKCSTNTTIELSFDDNQMQTICNLSIMSQAHNGEIIESVEQQDGLGINKEDNNVIFVKPKTVKKPRRQIKHSTSNVIAESFFTANPVKGICNSTAVSSQSEAYGRQINASVQQQGELRKNANECVNQVKTKNTKIQTSSTSSNTNTSLSLIANSSGMKKTGPSSTVTSTIIRSPEADNTSPFTHVHVKETSNFNISENELSDSALVTSTTNIELPKPAVRTIENDIETLEPKLSSTSLHYQNDNLLGHMQTDRGILIYTPHNRSLAPAHSFTNDGFFTITKEHLSSIIGEKAAEKFLKYYIGRRRFNTNSTIYYRPPRMTDINSNNISSSSDSDDDLDNLGQYGDLYEYLNKSIDRNIQNS